MSDKKYFPLLLATALLMLLCSCVVMPDPGANMPDSGPIPVQGDTGPNPPQYAALVATTDYSLTGGFGVISLDTRQAYLPDPQFAADAVSPDPVAAAFGGYVFVINRFTYDNITVLDQRFKLVRQYSLPDTGCGFAVNPQDLAFVSESKAYLSRYECRGLWIINPLTGAFLGSIDLTAAGYGGPDGIPEMSGLLIHGSTLYVAVQNLDRRNWQPSAQSWLVMVNTTTDTLAGDVPLLGKNPSTDVVYDPSLGRILVGDAGVVSAIGDGGIEAIDPATGTSEGFIIDETALGGNIGDFAIASATKGYATVTDASFHSLLVAFDPGTGLRDPAPLYSAASGFTLWDLALNDRGELYLCDRSATAPGIVIIDTSTDTLVTPSPINLWLPPFSIVFLK
ncbi:MAG TPA: hypothetical protein VM658_17955 [bacterium]|nr:hypothetical protein [bacterium]